MTITNDSQRADLIEAGRRLAGVLAALRGQVAPGVSTDSLDDFAEAMIRDGGDKPAFLGYTPEGAGGPHPAAVWGFFNYEGVGGTPNQTPKMPKKKEKKEGEKKKKKGGALRGPPPPRHGRENPGKHQKGGETITHKPKQR